jgi:hypothetical protein
VCACVTLGSVPTAFISLCFLGLCAQVTFETWLSSVGQKPQKWGNFKEILDFSNFEL